MSTTAIFAELLVAGIEVLLWMLLLVFGVSDTAYHNVDWGKLKEWVPILALIAVGVSYALGVVIDRLADSTLRGVDRRFKASVFGKERVPVGRIRMTSAYKSAELAAYLGYIRSRMRVARALTFNSVFLTIAVVVFLWRRLAITPCCVIVLSTVGAAIFVASLFAWYRISITFYKRLLEARSILRTDESLRPLFSDTNGVEQ